MEIITFRHKTFCASPGCNNECGRKMKDEERAQILSGLITPIRRQHCLGETEVIVTDYIKGFIDRLKWKALCKKCGMNPDTCELECDHEWTEGGHFIGLHCKKCYAGKPDDK